MGRYYQRKGKIERKGIWKEWGGIIKEGKSGKFKKNKESSERKKRKMLKEKSVE